MPKGTSKKHRSHDVLEAGTWESDLGYWYSQLSPTCPYSERTSRFEAVIDVRTRLLVLQKQAKSRDCEGNHVFYFK